MVRLAQELQLQSNRFMRNEAGTISVDWAIMGAVVTALALATAGSLTDSTNTFEGKVEATLKNNLSNVEGTASGTRDVGNGVDEEGEPVEFGFAGISDTTSMTTASVECGEAVTACGRSAETITESFLMTDGSVWIRNTTTYADDGNSTVVWLDETGRETTEIPDLPGDLPTVAIN